MSEAYVTRSIRLPSELNRKLAALATRELSSVNREIIIAVRAHLDADRRGKGKAA